jgi:hypothetical protein
LFFPSAFSPRHQADVPRWYDRGDRMLIDHLLLPLGIEHNSKTVKSGYNASELKAVYKKNRHLLFVRPRLIEKDILQILYF